MKIIEVNEGYRSFYCIRHRPSFNTDTVDKVLEHQMNQREKVAGSDLKDALADVTMINLPGVGAGMNLAKFKGKARQF